MSSVLLAMFSFGYISILLLWVCWALCKCLGESIAVSSHVCLVRAFELSSYVCV